MEQLDFQRWITSASQDSELKRTGALSTFQLELVQDVDNWIAIKWDRGKLISLNERIPSCSGTDGTHLKPLDLIVLRGNSSTWAELVDPSPKPRRHDILSLTKQTDGIVIEKGQQAFIRHLPTVNRLFQLLRDHDEQVPKKTASQSFSNKPVFEEVVGRYVHFSSGGKEHRIYFEDSYPNRPHLPVLLALHTAGADSRQYRHLLNDSDITSQFRVIAFDLPAHGKSLPSTKWWQEEYRLTTDAYASLVEDFADTLSLQRPVVLGCSMAGSLVLELARRQPHRWRGVIGLSGALKLQGRFQDWPLSPSINAQQVIHTWTASLMAPHGPEDEHYETRWIYSQGGPGIYRGDTYFYSEDFDLRGKAAQIDTSVCPVYLLTGEYDHACTPSDTDAAREAITGASGYTMERIGHFPMSENYSLFRTHLLPVLHEVIASNS
ncbi:alpha/beta fold hydrolase [Nesterenkonia ebinurensis]|uniref:alpha/beta fold hydrolase n=1 Tax=Nesterenkonia ebinurensis TaxID=2608252 RepID=UPI00123CF7D7|nr:alpha/beta hydrolase [Nesterenkonia ebinurensis]